MQYYALKIMSAESFSWLVVVLLIVLNYARINWAVIHISTAAQLSTFPRTPIVMQRMMVEYNTVASSEYNDLRE